MRPSFAKLACIFAIVSLVIESKIYVNGADVMPDLVQYLPLAYKDVLGPSATVNDNIWGAYSIRYSQNADEEVTIIFSGPYKKGWVGIGVSKTGRMLGSSAMVGWTDKKGINMIKQYLLQDYNPDKVVVNKGELRLSKEVPPASVVLNGTIYMAFKLKFPNNAMSQKIIMTSSSEPPKGDVLSMHTEATTLVIDFGKGEVDTMASSLKEAHGVVAFLAWQVLIPTGILFPVYFKHLDPQWFYLHMTVQIIGYVLAFTTVLLGFKVSFGLNVDWSLHKVIGVTVQVFATLQVLAIWFRPAKDSAWRPKWNKYHHGVGYTAVILALINVLIGMGHGGPLLKAVFALWIIVFIIVVFFVIPRMTRRNEPQVNHPVFRPGH